MSKLLTKANVEATNIAPKTWLLNTYTHSETHTQIILCIYRIYATHKLVYHAEFSNYEYALFWFHFRLIHMH